jgi:hypothetical protein
MLNFGSEDSLIVPESEDLKRVVQDAIRAAAQADFVGHDPYDIKAHRTLIPLQRHSLTKFAFEILASNFPLFLRTLFQVRPAENNKCLGLLIRAFVRLYIKSGDANYLRQAKELFDRLVANRSQQSSNLCWGYPFSWQTSEKLYPPNFPNIAATIQGGLAILTYWEATRLAEGPELLESVVSFILDDLQRSRQKGRLFLSYSPADQYQVLNVNAQMMGFLAQVSRALGISSCDSLIAELLETIIAFQRPDGSWPYRVDEEPSFVDNYHTAILLENLRLVSENRGHEEGLHAFQKGLRFYKENLLADNAVPLLRTGLRLPIDIHSCAHGIILLKQANDDDWRRILKWTLTEMYEDGRFFYRVYRDPSLGRLSFKERLLTLSVFRRKDRTFYMRWSQAWMLLALAEVYEQ